MMPIAPAWSRSALACALLTASTPIACGSSEDAAAMAPADGGDDATLDTGSDAHLLPDTAKGETADTAPADTGPGDTSIPDARDATVGDVDTEVRDADAPDADAGDAALSDAASLAAAAHPPPRPATTATGGATKWFAVSHFYLGLTLPPGTLTLHSPWEHYGYDIDERLTTATDSATSTNSCRRVAGSSTSVLTDAFTGGDNNFGAHLMQTLKSVKSDIEDVGNRSLTNGVYTLLFRLDNVGPADNANVPGALYLAGPYKAGTAAPTYTASDVWSITSDSLTDGTTISAAKYAFPSGYMAGGRWVSGDAGASPAPIPLPFVGVGIPVPVAMSSTLVSFRLDGAGGIISGAAATSALQVALTPPLKAGGICPGTSIYSLVTDTITQSADLVLGAPKLQDVTVDCDALSIGLGFEATPTGTPTTVVSPLVMPAGSCP